MKNLILILLVIASNLNNLKAQSYKSITVTVKNTLNVSREFETVEIQKSNLKLNNQKDFKNLAVRDKLTKSIVVSQLIDENQDGEFDLLIFQPKIEALSEKKFELVVLKQKLKSPHINYCYSRFVPERTDDYAWENDKIAFRTYGPTAQKMVEEKIPGGTLSSGIDAWLKKVEYPIINKWYEKTISGKGSYHEDTGEGLDNFHVGVSRGIGGIAVKKDSMYYVSKNFIDWKTVTTGPIRTSFILEYENWDAAGTIINEKKHISLDYGSNLSKFQIEISGTNTISAGLTLHENDGLPTYNLKSGWVSYWQPHEKSELGTAIVVPKNTLISTDFYVTQKKDESNLYAQIEVNGGKTIYYAGFTWMESGQFSNKKSWETYLDDYAIKLNNPLITIIN